MQVHRPLPAQGCQEQAFPAEEHGLQISRPLNVVLNPFGESDNTTSIHSQGFSVELFFDHRAAGMDKGESLPFQFLQDKTFATEKPGADFFVKCDGNLGAQGRTEKSIFLADERPIGLILLERNNFSRVGRRKGDSPLHASVVGEMSYEQRFPSEYPLSS